MGNAYDKGLVEVAPGVFAYLQPDGGWGWSNAGLIAAGEGALLVDTLFDRRLTEEMLATMRAATPAARSIGTVVNTHANGDHTYGNGALPEAEIIASTASAREMDEVPPALLDQFMKAAPNMGEAGAYLSRIFGAFQFEGLAPRAPTRTFSHRLDLVLGDRRVDLIEVGPAHTHGDVLVMLPDDRVVFTGDILFAHSTPIMWAGPVANWIAACDLILGAEVDVIVPGHGPIADKAAVAAQRAYLVYIRDEARKRYDAGLSWAEASEDIALGDYSSWGDAERIAVNVATLYREFSGRPGPDTLALFGQMAKIDRKFSKSHHMGK
ncbi:MBL fold metallo-hydrolase [Zavarzinia sp. CC-PAN008]|uniref:MBL fold metallo-hydrolase n=1 Tax=Zavarzinia sp. CC-PAN008 TaxID=3243332 RepID=UPI003F743251